MISLLSNIYFPPVGKPSKTQPQSTPPPQSIPSDKMEVESTQKAETSKEEVPKPDSSKSNIFYASNSFYVFFRLFHVRISISHSILRTALKEHVLIVYIPFKRSSRNMLGLRNFVSPSAPIDILCTSAELLVAMKRGDHRRTFLPILLFMYSFSYHLDSVWSIEQSEGIFKETSSRKHLQLFTGSKQSQTWR